LNGCSIRADMESDFQVYHFNALKQQIRDIAVKDKSVVFLDPRLVPDWYSRFASDMSPKNVDADALKFAAGMMGLIDELAGKGSSSEKDLRDPAGSMKISFTVPGIGYLMSGERDKMEWLTHRIDHLGKLAGREGERYEPVLMDMVNLRRFYSRTRQSSELMVFTPDDPGLMGSLEQYLSLINPPFDKGDSSGVSAVARSLASAAVYSSFSLYNPTVITSCEDVKSLAECLVASMTEEGRGHLVSAVLASYPVSFQVLKTNDPAALIAGRNIFRTSTSASAVGSKKYSIVLSSNRMAEELKSSIGSMLSDSVRVRSDQSIIDYQNKKNDVSSPIIPYPAVQIPVVAKADRVNVKVVPPSADAAVLSPLGGIGDLVADLSRSRATGDAADVGPTKTPATIDSIRPSASKPKYIQSSTTKVAPSSADQAGSPDSITNSAAPADRPIEAPNRKPRSRPAKPGEVSASQDIPETYRTRPSSGPVPCGPAPDRSDEATCHPLPIRDSPAKGPEYSSAAQGQAASSLPPQGPPGQPPVSQVQAQRDFRLGESEVNLEVVIKPGSPWRLRSRDKPTDVSVQADVSGLGSNALQLLSIYQSNPLSPNDEGPVLQQKMGILVVASDLASKAKDPAAYQRVCDQIGAAKEFVKRRVAGLNALIDRCDCIMGGSIDSYVQGDTLLESKPDKAPARLAASSTIKSPSPVDKRYVGVPDCLRKYMDKDVTFGDLAEATGRKKGNVYWAAWSKQLNKTGELGAYMHLSLKNARLVFPTLFKSYSDGEPAQKAPDRSRNAPCPPKKVRDPYAGVPECLRPYIGKDVTFVDLAEATGSKLATIYTAAWSRNLNERGKFGRLAHMRLSLDNARQVLSYLFKKEESEPDDRKTGASADRHSAARPARKEKLSSRASRPPILTVSEIEELGVPRGYIYYQVREGHVPFTKDAGLRGKLRIRLTGKAKKALGLR